MDHGLVVIAGGGGGGGGSDHGLVVATRFPGLARGIK